MDDGPSYDKKRRFLKKVKLLRFERLHSKTFSKKKGVDVVDTVFRLLCVEH